jgi:hypothetical protein
VKWENAVKIEFGLLKLRWVKIIEGEGWFMEVGDEIRLKLLVMEVFGGEWGGEGWRLKVVKGCCGGWRWWKELVRVVEVC